MRQQAIRRSAAWFQHRAAGRWVARVILDRTDELGELAGFVLFGMGWLWCCLVLAILVALVGDQLGIHSVLVR